MEKLSLILAQMLEHFWNNYSDDAKEIFGDEMKELKLFN